MSALLEWLKDNWQWLVTWAALGWLWIARIATYQSLTEHAAVLNQHAQAINDLSRRVRALEATVDEEGPASAISREGDRPSP